MVEILSDNSYAKAKSNLTLALGKDIVGNPACMNLAKAHACSSPVRLAPEICRNQRLHLFAALSCDA